MSSATGFGAVLLPRLALLECHMQLGFKHEFTLSPPCSTGDAREGP